MDHIVVDGDQLIVWWPNGHGYDLFTVVQAVDHVDFQLSGKFEVTNTGQYVKVEGENQT
jgi:hypothetical protein